MSLSSSTGRRGSVRPTSLAVQGNSLDAFSTRRNTLMPGMNGTNADSLKRAFERRLSTSPTPMKPRTPSPRSPSIIGDIDANRALFTEAEAKDRWKNVGKCIMMVNSVSSQFQRLEVTRKELEKTQDQIKSYLESKYEVDHKVMFDPSIYKRPKQGLYFSRELEEVARKNRKYRTENQIRSLRLTLRDCSSFGAYPQCVQTELSRVGLLERFGRGRVILREGHIPGRVYFILSGTVVLTKFNKTNKAEETQQILNRGDLFGDREVLDQGMRAMTVTTALDSVFWSVEGQDFKNAMTRNLGVTDNWNHKSAPEIVTDGNVRKESLEKKTDDVRKRRSVASAPVSRSGSIQMAITARSAIHNFLSSLVWFDQMPTNKFLEDPKAATLVYFRNNKSIVSSSSNNELLCFIRNGKCDVITRITIETNCPNANTVSCFDTGMDYHEGVKGKLKPATGIIPQRGDRISMISRPLSAPVKSIQQQRPGSKKRKGNGIPARPVTTIGRSTITRPGTAKYSTKSAPLLKTRQEFLKVCTLEAGDAYGLTAMFSLDPELETSLVSRGCECVIVQKDTFALLLDKQTKENLRKKILFYPTYDEMKKKLSNHYLWSTYKDDLKIRTGRPPAIMEGWR